MGLGLAIGLVLLLTVTPTFLVGYETARRNTAELVRDKATLIVSSMEQRVRLLLDPVEAQLEYLGRLMVRLGAESSEPAVLESLLLASLAAAPQVSVVALVTPDARVYRAFRNRPQAGLVASDWSDDASFRDIIDRARRTQSVRWEGLFLAENVNQTYLNAVLPLWWDGHFAGALLAGIFLTELSHFVARHGEFDLEIPFILHVKRLRELTPLAT